MNHPTRLTIALLISLIAVSFTFGQTTDQRKPELIVQTGTSSVQVIAFSPDGKLLASGSLDETIKLWDAATGQELRTLTGHSSPVISLAFSPDGKTLASGSSDHIVKLWDVVTGYALHNLKGHTYNVNSVAFSSDGKLLASGSCEFRDSNCWKGDIKLWDSATGEVFRALTPHIGNVYSLAFSPNGKLFASAGCREQEDIYCVKWEIKLWNAATWQELRSLTGHTDTVRSVAFSPDGKVLASGGEDKIIKLWNVETGQEIRTLTGNTHTVTSVVFSPDGKTLASSGWQDKTVRLWNVETGQQIKSIEGHDSWEISIAYSSDGKVIASADSDTIKLWDAATGQGLRSLTKSFRPVYLVRFSPDGKMLAWTSNDDTIKLWDVATGNVLRVLMKGHTTSVNSIAFSPSGKMLASGSNDETIKLWNVETGQEIRTLTGHTNFVLEVAFSPDGKILASAGNDDKIKLWDTATGQELRTLQGDASSVAFSPDGKLLASAGCGEYNKDYSCIKGEVKLWDAATGQKLHTLTGDAFFYLVAFSPDGKLLASENGVNTKVWNVASEQMLKSLQTDDPNTKREVFAVVPDLYRNSKYYLTSLDDKFQLKRSENGKLNLVEAKSGKLLVSLIALNEKDWVVTTPDGLFDGSPNGWKQLLWRFDNNTFNYAPVEAFFKEFYRPGLLQDIFAGNKIEPPTQDLSKIDIRQPFIKISAIDGKAVDSSALLPDEVSAQKKSIKVKVEITDNVSEPRSGISKDSSSDAQDVRLFRNGSLVKLWNGNAFNLAEKDGCKQIAATKDSPRKAVCEAEIQISAGKNEFTVYGFNRENVKSSDDTAIVNGAESLKRDGTLYVLAVGVNDYTPIGKSEWDLNYAVKDVVEIGKTLQDNQAKLGNLKQYSKTEIITLTDELATKENILKAFARFANGEQIALSANASDKLKAEFAKIKQTQPEDAFIIYFAGHGVSKGQRFYLLPHGFTGDGAKLEEQSVSDLELNEYLEKVDAGKLLMVIDACQSGAALGGKNDGKAPMNSKGFAQLAYDKGMLILTAAQSQQAALEAVKIGDKTIENGLLTYALLQAFSNTQADKDGNNQLWEREWFDFAVGEVPLFQREAMRRREADLKNDPQAKGRSGIYYVNGDKKTNADERNVQTPRVFYRREPEIKPFILANP